MSDIQPVELRDCRSLARCRRTLLRVAAVASTAALLVSLALGLTAAARAYAGDSASRADVLPASVRAAAPPASVTPPPPLPAPGDDPPVPPPPPPSDKPPAFLPPPSEVAPAPPPPPPVTQPPAPVATPQATAPPPEAAPAPTSGAATADPAPSRPGTPELAAHTAAVRPAPTIAPIDAPAAARQPVVAARPASPSPLVVRARPARSSPPAATAAPRSDEALPLRPPLSGLLPYDLRAHPQTAITLLGAAFTLLLLAGSGRQLAASGGGRPHSSQHGGGSAPESEFIYEGVEVEHIGGAVAVVASGDLSRTWGWPGTQTIDRLSTALPARLAARSPLIARVLADGTYLRAILGSASLLVLFAGAILGVAAIHDTGGDALPPAATLTIAIAVLGVLDAAAGLFAVVIFFGGVLLLGGLESNADLRTLIALSALWFVVPVLAGAARPLRRPPTRGLAQSWDRAADFVIASLIGAWAVKNIIEALPGLAGLQLPIADYADKAALAVLVALVLRMAAETITSHLYPKRLTEAEPRDLADPSALQRLGACLLRATIFVYFAMIVVGPSWQLWVGTALFALPQMLSIVEDRLPSVPALARALPKGLVEIVVMLLVVTVIGALLADANSDSPDFLANSFVILSIPGFVLSVAALVVRDADEPEMDWPRRLAGVVVLAFGVLLSLGMVP